MFALVGLMFSFSHIFFTLPQSSSHGKSKAQLDSNSQCPHHSLMHYDQMADIL